MHQPTCYIFILNTQWEIYKVTVFFGCNSCWIFCFLYLSLCLDLEGRVAQGSPPGLPVYNELYILYIAYDKYYSTNSNRNLNASSRKSCNSLRNRCCLEKFINTKPCPIFYYTNLEKCTISLIYHCKTAFQVQPWPKKER